MIVIRTSDQRTIQTDDDMYTILVKINAASQMDGNGFVTVKSAEDYSEIVVNIQHIIKFNEFTQNPIG